MLGVSDARCLISQTWPPERRTRAKRFIHVNGRKALSVACPRARRGYCKPGDYEADGIRALPVLRPRADRLPAGVGSGFMSAVAPAQRALVVSTPDPVCLRDCNKTRIALEYAGVRSQRLVVNRFSGKASVIWGRIEIWMQSSMRLEFA